ncbi:MAG: serine--tRNA ligase [Candidatus Dadabacteria bacterium]|nr:serine--tRNA ligase [Candidatus Dadabacteria bacterium]MDE0663240.1 serine--tRNA ligase [Candidatus Dadabacteria bacterium]
MLDPKLVEQNIDLVGEKLATRGFETDLSEFAVLNSRRKEIIKRVETLEHQRNEGSRKVGALKRSGDQQGLAELLPELKALSEEVKDLNEKKAEVEGLLREFLLTVPNMPDSSVPEGPDDTANVEIRKWGEPRDFDFEVKDHVLLGAELDILDLPRATKIAGARFALYKNAGARLERALINFMLDVHTKQHGYTEVLTPFVANTESLTGTGNLPKFEEDLFKLSDTDYYMIPTAEVPVTNIHRDEIIPPEMLPIKYVAYTPCFRKEAGSYGKDVHGIIRQHQFNKVELVRFADPENSYEELEMLTADAAKILELLGIPYRVVLLCTGDMGFSSAKTYDLEVWVPSEGRYREISSCSNFEAFQARRANIRYRKSKGSKPAYLHTLNGSGVAVGRALLAIVENFQTEEGTVEVPEVLVPYMDGIRVIGR